MAIFYDEVEKIMGRLLFENFLIQTTAFAWQTTIWGGRE
jgi:hypothetical protein